MARNISAQQAKQPTPSFGDRLRFAVWLSGKTLGVDSAKELAGVLGKGGGQLSSWVNENPRPSWENIKLIGEMIGVNPTWLDDPSSKDAKEPTDWAGWWEPRAKKLVADPQRKQA